MILEDDIEKQLSELRESMKVTLNDLDVSGLEFIISVCEEMVKDKS